MDSELKMFIGIVILMLGLIGGIAGLSVYFENRGCQYVCDGNGHENAYRWDAGCWCRDETGVYNPEDSRNDR